MMFERDVFVFHGEWGVLERPALADRVRRDLSRCPVVGLVGPRQCGKTTLARRFLPSGSPAYFDLEDPRSLARLEQPMTALEACAVSS
jgi:hypothetical protein